MTRTLVVDDHNISSRFAVAALRQSAGTVKLALNGREALTTALTWYPELICMDIHLPDINGLDVIRQLRLAWPPDRALPRIIILTGDDSGLKPSDLAVLNIDGLLVKPVSGRQLRKAARLHRTICVPEPDPPAHNPDLRKLFREELEQRLPELDQCISNFDCTRATRILHQLIASSAMCKERKLESTLRELDASCRRGDSTADLARIYFSLIESAREFLYRPAHFRQ